MGKDYIPRYQASKLLLPEWDTLWLILVGNQALQNLSTALDSRQDVGLLIQSAVFQELLKLKSQYFYDFKIHFWRTQSGAEVDFIIYKNEGFIIPIEIKYTNMNDPVISRSFRSFVEAYRPKYGFFITKNFNKKFMLEDCEVNFISFYRLIKFLEKIRQILE